MAVCQYHRDRPGVGLCMRCRAVICAACCTRVDGVNHCHACLKVLGQRQELTQASRSTNAPRALALFALAWLLLLGLGWIAQGRMAP